MTNIQPYYLIIYIPTSIFHIFFIIHIKRKNNKTNIKNNFFFFSRGVLQNLYYVRVTWSIMRTGFANHVKANCYISMIYHAWT